MREYDSQNTEVTLAHDLSKGSLNPMTVRELGSQYSLVTLAHYFAQRFTNNQICEKGSLFQ